jgi:hypothetical protein
MFYSWPLMPIHRSFTWNQIETTNLPFDTSESLQLDAELNGIRKTVGLQVASLRNNGQLAKAWGWQHKGEVLLVGNQLN